jgi:hypothetical protein
MGGAGAVSRSAKIRQNLIASFCFKRLTTFGPFSAVSTLIFEVSTGKHLNFATLFRDLQNHLL